MPVESGMDVISEGKIRVLLVEDMTLLRDALVALLSSQSDVEIVADMECDDTVLSTAIRTRPDVAVIDVTQSALGRVASIRDLQDSLPTTQVVALTVGNQPGLLGHLLDAKVAGIVDKSTSANQLLGTIRGVASGLLMIDHSLVTSALMAGECPLTPREQQVLRLAAEGASGPEIAKRIGLSRGTVRNYLSKVMTKTDARTRIDAVQIARNAGWL